MIGIFKLTSDSFIYVGEGALSMPFFVQNCEMKS